MEAPSLQKLDKMKYSELQKLAKAAGLKANVKADRLLRTLKTHFHPSFCAENNSSDSDGNSTLPDDVQGSLDDEEEPVSVSHVTLRRGRGKKGNKADPSPETKNKGKPVQGDNMENDTEETSVSTSETKIQQDETQEISVVAVEKTKRRRSKARRSSAKRPGSKIPKLSGVSGSKPSTPNFKKLHEAHFKKMESIDKYLERKQKRLDAISSSIQEVKDSEHLSQKKTPGSNKKKSLPSRFSLLSPVPQIGSLFSAKTPLTQRSAGKRSILVNKSAAKQSTFSSSKMNVRFSGATKDNEHKYSLVKTPARKSSTFMPNTNISEPRKSLPLLSKTKFSQDPEEKNIPAVTTPFKFTAETMATPNTNKKMKFDLQASLSRPLGYQPHKGKLKPWGETKENKDEAHSRSFVLKSSYKQPPISTREERRKQHEKGQKSKRDRALGSRRGVAIA